MGVSWWDADTGIERSHDDFTHPGGELRLTAPPWSRHLAFKLWRQ
jgi:hypothetical protein